MTSDNLRGLPVVAWRNRIGDAWTYTDRDLREVHDNGKPVEPLVLATDYAALLSERDALRERLRAVEGGARRWQWLASTFPCEGFQAVIDAENADELAAAIDAAIDAQAGAGGGG